MERKKLYLVTSRRRDGINEREALLFRLGKEHFDTVLICRGERDRHQSDVWEVKPVINPTGVLRVFGLEGVKRNLDRWLFFPSPFLLYVDAVYRKLRRAIRMDFERGCEVTLVLSLPAHDLCILGLRLKGEFPRLNWICDWQDLWSNDAYYMQRLPAPYRSRALRLERTALQECNLNVTTNPEARRFLERRFELPSERCRSIYHPFDEGEAFRRERIGELSEKCRKKVRMVFLGTLFKPPKVPGERLLEALSHVRGKGIDVHLDLFGGEAPGSVPAESGLASWKGRLRHEEIVPRLAGYDLLMLVLADLDNCRLIMNIKLPSYLVAGPPICAIVPERSAVASIIERTGTGYVVPAGKDWGEGLLDVLDRYCRGDIPQRNEEEVARFGWKNISREWLAIL